MLRRKRRVWSAVRKDAEAVRTGARRGALAARRGVKKGASDSYPDALARVRTEDLFGFAGAALIAGLPTSLATRRTTMDRVELRNVFALLAMRDGLGLP